MYSSPNGTIQGINQTEIAERHGVTPSCISYYIRTWAEDTDHPFPKPTCKVQQWITRSDGLEQWGRPFLNYDPWEVIVWFSKLDEASTRRRSEGQRNATRRALFVMSCLCWRTRSRTGTQARAMRRLSNWLWLPSQNC